MFKKLTLILSLLLTSISYSKPVLISFDGSANLDMWQDTLDFAKDNNVKFTYFISAPYFLTESEEQANPYWAKTEIHEPPLKFRKDEHKNGIKARFNYLDRAIREGHEIGSHLVGHYNGEKWTYEQWKKELDYFNWTFKKLYSNECLDNLTNEDFKFKGMCSIKGIRAPELGVNEAYFKAIKEAGYEYDSSLVQGQSLTPTVKEIYIRKININKVLWDDEKSPTKTLPFDYNFSILPQVLNNNYTIYPFMPQILFFDSLIHDYMDSSEPLQICLHFEKFEGQPYYKAMKHFVEWAGKDAEYLTYEEYANRKVK